MHWYRRPTPCSFNIAMFCFAEPPFRPAPYTRRVLLEIGGKRGNQTKAPACARQKCGYHQERKFPDNKNRGTGYESNLGIPPDWWIDTAPWIQVYGNSRLDAVRTLPRDNIPFGSQMSRYGEFLKNNIILSPNIIAILYCDGSKPRWNISYNFYVPIARNH